LAVLLVFATGACSDPVTPVSEKLRANQKKKAPPPEPPPPPASCLLVLPGVNLASLYGLGGFHREQAAPGDRYYFTCEWRVHTTEGTAPRRDIVYQAACGDEVRRMKHMVGKKRVGDSEATIRAGMGGRAFFGEGLGREPTVRLLFESAAMPGCWVRIQAPGSVRTAARLARSIEAFLESRAAP